MKSHHRTKLKIAAARELRMAEDTLVVSNSINIKTTGNETEQLGRHDPELFVSMMDRFGQFEGLELSSVFDDVAIFKGSAEVLQNAQAYIEEHHSLNTAITPYGDTIEEMSHETVPG